jgi:hypothetical protein
MPVIMQEGERVLEDAVEQARPVLARHARQEVAFAARVVFVRAVAARHEFDLMVERALATLGDPYGTRTRVFAVRGRRPRPLDEGAMRQLGSATAALGQLGRLGRVEARVAMAVIAVGEVGARRQPAAPPVHSVTSRPVISIWRPTPAHAFRPARGEEGFELGEDALRAAGS